MKIIAYGAGGVVAAILVMWAVGLAIPAEHSVSGGASLTVPPDSVWAVLTDYQGYPTWRKELLRVEMLPPREGHPVWREYAAHDQNVAFEAVDAAVNSRLVIVIADRNLPYEGSWTITLASENGGTRVSIDEEGRVNSPILRFIARVFFNPTSSIENYLKALGERFGKLRIKNEEL